ncbi:diguanylate cyclase [Aeromicrobium sp. P5_D10]
MSDSLLLITLIAGTTPLICVGIWSWTRDRTSFVGRVLLFGIASCTLWAIGLTLLVESGDSFAFRVVWLPSVTLTAAAIYMLAKVANDPTWRPSRWLLIAIAAETSTFSILTVTNDQHHLVSKSLTSTHIEYAWGFGFHVLFCFVLLGSTAMEMSRRTSDPSPWMRRFAALVIFLVIATCTVQVLQIRVSQAFAAIALIAYAFAAHRGGLGHRDPDLAQAFDPNDHVTGVLSRRSIEQRLSQLVSHRPDLCHVFVIDIDRFKGVNDNFGHLVGDHVLATVAQRLREHDPRLMLGRWGGDEFVGLLRGIAPADVAQIAVDLETSCAASPIAISDNRHVAISVSIGTAACHGDDWHAWVAEADAQMYARKDRGRDDITWSDRRH